MFCIQDFCPSGQLIFIVAVIALAVIGIVVYGLRRLSHTEVAHVNATVTPIPQTVVDNSTPEPSPEVEEEEEPEEPTVKVGQKVLYDKSDGLECYFVVTRVDDENVDVYGYFFVELPAGSEALKPPHFDDDKEEVRVTFKTLTKGAREVYFDVSNDPDELDAYYIKVDGVTVEPASAI